MRAWYEEQHDTIYVNANHPLLNSSALQKTSGQGKEQRSIPHHASVS